MAQQAHGIEGEDERSSAKAAIGGVADEVKGVASELKEAAIDQGREFYAAARDQATGFVDQRKNEAAQSVADLATSLRETGRSFEDRPAIGGFVGSAADGLDQLASGLRDRTVVDLYGDIEAYARRSPVTVGAVALVAGFLLARFIKASSDNLSDQGVGRRAERRRRNSAPSAAV